jgi:hypothetical protein
MGHMDFLSCKKIDSSFCIHVNELVYMSRFLYNMWQCNNFSIDDICILKCRKQHRKTYK